MYIFVGYELAPLSDFGEPARVRHDSFRLQTQNLQATVSQIAKYAYSVNFLSFTGHLQSWFGKPLLVVLAGVLLLSTPNGASAWAVQPLSRPKALHCPNTWNLNCRFSCFSLSFVFLMLFAQSASLLWSSMGEGGGAVRATSAACGSAAGQAYSMADASKK